MSRTRPFLAIALLSIGFLFLPAITTTHAIVIFLGLDEVSDSLGVSIGTNSLAILVVDKDGSGTFDTPEDFWTTTVGSFGSDYVAWRGDFSGSGTAGVFLDSPSFTIGTVNIPFNVAFGIYWFPTLTTASTSLSTGNPYGFYTSINATQFGSDSAWNTGGNDAATLNINAFTINNTGNLTSNPDPSGLGDTVLQATQTVIPEPSTWALLAGSLTTVMVLRRRRFKI